MMNTLFNHLKLLFLCLSLGLAVVSYGQEICNNGVDDDGDSLVDWNDDECTCADEVPLTAVTGSICKNTLKLTINIPGATSFQWYKDSVAIIGKTLDFLELKEVPGVEGWYFCVVTIASGCVTTIPYEVVIPDPIIVDLGVEYICPGECVQFGLFTLCSAGTFSNTAPSSLGCDSVTILTVQTKQNSLFSFRDTICTGQTYNYYDIAATTAGNYVTTITNSFGCDSIVTVRLSVLDALVDTVRASICEGDTLFRYGKFYTLPGIYQDTTTNANGCDVNVTIYLNSLTPSADTIYESICSGDTLRLHDVVAFESGDYVTTLTNSVGCDSILTISLTVLQPTSFFFSDTICTGETYNFFSISATTSGLYHDTTINVNGCDSIISVQLYVFDQVEYAIYDTICQGDTYVFNDISTVTAGVYNTIISSPTGCDSLVTVYLTVNRHSGETMEVTICDGETFDFYTISESTTGRYKTTITNAAGCDSVITVELTVQFPGEGVVNDTICQGATYDYFDISTDQSGIYQTTIQTPEGCDSSVTVNLFVRPPLSSVIFDTICQGATYTNNDIITTVSGIFTTQLSTDEGCDSTVTVNVFVKPAIVETITTSICQGGYYLLGQDTIRTAGTYNSLLTTPEGCDSTVQLILTIDAPLTSSMGVEICSGSTFELNDISTSEAGSFTTIFSTADGCDSIVQVVVTVSPPIETTSSATICEGETYSFDGRSLDASGTYVGNFTTSGGCDSIAMLDLTVEPLQRASYDAIICSGETFVMADIRATESGTYTARMSNAAGCDSLITVNLIVYAPQDHVDLGDDKELSLGYSIDVIPDYLYENLENIIWYDEHGNILGNERELLDYAPIEDVTIYLEGNDEYGCPAKDELEIRVNLDIIVTVPNIFSPNGDGTNDSFVVKANEAVISVNRVLIYDRWGEKVYEAGFSNDVDNSIIWDGTFNGKPVDPGVYVYYMELGLINGAVHQVKGDVTIVR